MAKKSRNSSKKYKRVLEALFAKKARAYCVELRLDDDHNVVVDVHESPMKVGIYYLKSTASPREQKKFYCRPNEYAFYVKAKSWTDLARRLDAGARVGKAFGWHEVVVFKPGDSVHAALVEFDFNG